MNSNIYNDLVSGIGTLYGRYTVLQDEPIEDFPTEEENKKTENITVVLNNKDKLILPTNFLLCCDYFRKLLFTDEILFNYDVIFKNHSTLVDMMKFVSVFGSARWNDRGSIPWHEYSVDSVIFYDHFPTATGKAMAKVVNDHVVGKPLGYLLDLLQFANYIEFKSLTYVLAFKIAVTFVKWHDADTEEERAAIYNPDQIVPEIAVKPKQIYPNYIARWKAKQDSLVPPS